MCDNMRFFLTKDKVKEVPKKYSSDSHASGDGVYQRFCRLCSGQHGLSSFTGSERYDRLLYNCFGILVTPLDSLICEPCVRQLTITERFKDMVESAFEEKTLSDSSSRTCVIRTEPETQTIKPPMIMVTQSKAKIVRKPKQKNVVKEKKTRNNPWLAKKTNTACSICKQRYPVMLQASSRPADFVCARCKCNQRSAVLRKCNLPSTVMLDRLGEQGDGKKLAKLDERTSLKPSIKKCESATKYHREPRKYNCSQCTQKFILPQRLAEHIKSAHSVGLDSSCIVCGKNLKTRANLERHLKVHTGELHECDICLKIFKSKPILQTHMIGHRKSLPASKLVGASTVPRRPKF